MMSLEPSSIVPADAVSDFLTALAIPLTSCEFYENRYSYSHALTKGHKINFEPIFRIFRPIWIKSITEMTKKNYVVTVNLNSNKMARCE
jgi:hypothetical protein